MLLEIERDKAITDKVILIQKVVRGFKDRCASNPFTPSFFFILFNGNTYIVKLLNSKIQQHTPKF